MTFPPEVWDGVLRRLRKALAPVSFEMWVPQIVARPDGESLDLVCPTQFHSDRIRDYFLTAIDDCVNAELGRRIPLRVKVIDPGEVTESIGTEPAGHLDSETEIEFAAGALEDTALSAAAGSLGGGTRQRGASIHALPRISRGSNCRTRETQSIGKAVQATMAIAAVASEAKPGLTGVPGANARGNSGVGAGRWSREAQRRNSRKPGQNRQAAFPMTFESFTVGSCNALAREAALALANQQQLSLNQIFIVSGSGLGKTHLSRAVIDTAAKAIGDRARYTTAESFTSEFTQAIRGNQMPNFKRRYRTQCELLVVEDVQFLEGKAATQLEFFHVVQHVLDCGGRVLLTSDKYPQELKQLDERVRARISAGFVAQVEAPDAAVRRNILRAKAAHGGIRLPDDCLDLLVEKVAGTVRELEGALIQLVTMASLFKRQINLDLTRESLEGRSPRLRSIALRATPADIIEAVAVFFSTSSAALASRSRRRDVLIPRQLAMYLCRRYTEASLADIGKALNRDHPSVANAIRKIERQLLENVRLRYQAEALIARLSDLGHRPLHSFD